MTLQERLKLINEELNRFHSSVTVETTSEHMVVHINIDGTRQELFLGESEEVVSAYLEGFYMATFKAGLVVDMLQENWCNAQWRSYK